MRVYIAGPMTGHPDYNRDGFEKGVAFCEEQGWIAINPWGVNALHEDKCPAGPKFTYENETHPWECWLKASLRQMLTCQEILMLPGWEQSRGASIEHHLAESVGMRVWYMSYDGTVLTDF